MTGSEHIPQKKNTSCCVKAVRPSARRAKYLCKFYRNFHLHYYSEQNDIGIFRLLDHYPPRVDWVHPKFLMERDEEYPQNLNAGRKVACVGFNGIVSESDGRRLRKKLQFSSRKVCTNLHSRWDSIEIPETNVHKQSSRWKHSIWRMSSNHKWDVLLHERWIERLAKIIKLFLK